MAPASAVLCAVALSVVGASSNFDDVVADARRLTLGGIGGIGGIGDAIGGAIEAAGPCLVACPGLTSLLAAIPSSGGRRLTLMATPQLCEHAETLKCVVDNSDACSSHNFGDMPDESTCENYAAGSSLMGQGVQVGQGLSEGNLLACGGACPGLTELLASISGLGDSRRLTMTMMTPLCQHKDAMECVVGNAGVCGEDHNFGEVLATTPCMCDLCPGYMTALGEYTEWSKTLNVSDLTPQESQEMTPRLCSISAQMACLESNPTECASLLSSVPSEMPDESTCAPHNIVGWVSTTAGSSPGGTDESKQVEQVSGTDDASTSAAGQGGNEVSTGIGSSPSLLLAFLPALMLSLPQLSVL